MQQRPSAATLQFKVLTSSSNRIYNNTLQQRSRNYSLKIQSQSRLLLKKKVNELNGGIRKSSKKTCTVLRAQEVAEISCFSSSFSAKSCSACYASCCIRSNVTATAAAFACCFASHSAASLPAVEADESSQ